VTPRPPRPGESLAEYRAAHPEPFGYFSRCKVLSRAVVEAALKIDYLPWPEQFAGEIEWCQDILALLTYIEKLETPMSSPNISDEPLGSVK